MIPRPVIPTLFPYTTLFRSDVGLDDGRDPGVSHHPPELDAIQKRDRAGGRREPLHCPYGMDLQLAVDRKSTRLNSSHMSISYAVFCLKKKKLNLQILLFFFP